MEASHSATPTVARFHLVAGSLHTQRGPAFCRFLLLPVAETFFEAFLTGAALPSLDPICYRVVVCSLATNNHQSLLRFREDALFPKTLNIPRCIVWSFTEGGGVEFEKMAWPSRGSMMELPAHVIPGILRVDWGWHS